MRNPVDHHPVKMRILKRKEQDGPDLLINLLPPEIKDQDLSHFLPSEKNRNHQKIVTVERKGLHARVLVIV